MVMCVHWKADPNGGKVFYLGKKKVSQEGTAAETRTCDHYQWSEMIFHVIPTQTTDFYVDSSAQPQLPFFSSQRVSKFGDVMFNNSFLSFVGPVNLTGKSNFLNKQTNKQTTPKT